MIREATFDDLDDINELGKIINQNFKKLYQMENALQYEYTKVYIYENDKQIKAFLHIENHFETTDIINIVVKKEEQGKHIGTRLLEYLIANCRAHKIMLEVNENNERALRLYTKVGFKMIHKRVKYYGDENAIIMERVL